MGEGNAAESASSRSVAPTVLLVAVVLVHLAALAMSARAGSLVADDAVNLVHMAMAALGALIATRAHANPIGWLLLGVGTLGAVQALATGVADLVLIAGVGPHELGLTAVAVVYPLWAPITLVPLTVVLLVFPDGRPVSRWWRPALWLAAIGIAGTAMLIALHPEVGHTPRWDVGNPIAAPEGAMVIALFQPAFLLVLAAMGSAVASLVIRFRRSRGVTRQQLKWMAYGCALAVALFVVGGVWQDDTPAGEVLSAGALLLIPASMAVAVLRYRLYDIDRLISRTLSYTLTISVLATAYAAIVIGAPRLLPVSLDSPITVAADTMQPTHVSLWLTRTGP